MVFTVIIVFIGTTFLHHQMGGIPYNSNSKFNKNHYDYNTDLFIFLLLQLPCRKHSLELVGFLMLILAISMEYCIIIKYLDEDVMFGVYRKPDDMFDSFDQYRCYNFFD